MRDFDHPPFRHARARGRNRLAKPLIVGAVFIVALCLLVMSLWNALLPALIGVKTIGFWQAAGLLLLCRILFGGLGIRPGMFGHARRRMHERWMQMTPEQRDAFMKQRREGFGHRGQHCRYKRRDEQPPSSDDNHAARTE
ncbi:hypothetical protein [Pantoea ananatis]|uniref:hypothetical protein n=1 Tax=Pantoea ananas TaxID=553 RepID=UPI001B30B413|nr:hypothetical protein [Pantoea ananatis]